MRLDLQNIRIMVAEDIPFMRHIIRTILKAFGAGTIYEAVSVSDALTCLELNCPDLLIIDWMLELDSGLDLVRQIRTLENSDLSVVPIIMLSAYNEPKHIMEAMSYGVNDYLRKPVSTYDLYSRIRSLVVDSRPYVKTTTFHGPIPRNAPCIGSCGLLDPAGFKDCTIYQICGACCSDAPYKLKVLPC